MSEDVKPYGAGDERDDNAPARLKELRALTEQLGLSQRGVAREIEVDERTVRYWFSGQYPTPLAAIYSLRHLRDAKQQEQLRELSEPRRVKLPVHGTKAVVPTWMISEGNSMVIDADGRVSVQNGGRVVAWVDLDRQPIGEGVASSL
jgi:DNA-binding XRE family transcriptional regulator